MVMQLTKNRLELVREAANKLQMVGSGQSLEPEYAAQIDSRVDPLVLQLAGDAICYVGDLDLIPGEWFDALSGLLANLCASMVNKAFDPNIKLYYENMLKKITASESTYERTQAEYF